MATDGALDSLSRAKSWINSRPLTSSELGGKVVLVQFWTFTCINWLRTLPYTRAWADRYRDAGLIVIGAHTPEFAFEHDIDNVRRMVRQLDVSYPVAIDSDYGIWNGFDNHYWPALYLLDGKGHLQYHHFGEGAYDESERRIQQLLANGGAQIVSQRVTPIEGRGIEAAADWSDLMTPETYVGYGQAENFASASDGSFDRPAVYSVPRELQLNQWAIGGDWTVQKDRIVLNRPSGHIAFRFHARDVHLVMGPRTGAAPTRYQVSLDGQPAASAHGVDVDAQGSGVANEQRLYQLIRQPKPIVDRTLQIEFLDSGVESFVFTFG